jgi:amidase
MGPILGDFLSGFVCEHAITRTVRDSAALLDATAGPAPGDPYCAPPKERAFLEEVCSSPGRLKIGWLNSLPEGWSGDIDIHPDCRAAAGAAAMLCENLGHIVEEVDAKQLAWPTLNRSFGRVFVCGAAHFCIYWENELGKKMTADQVEPMTWISRQAGLKYSGGEYLANVQDLQRFSRKLAEFRIDRGYDLLLSPTMTVPPFELGSFTPTEDDPARGFKASNAFVAFTKIQNITGDPAMSVPLFWNEQRVPIGVQFVGRFGDEATLLRLAGQLEEAVPWAGKQAPIHCAA